MVVRHTEIHTRCEIVFPKSFPARAQFARKNPMFQSMIEIEEIKIFVYVHALLQYRNAMIILAAFRKPAALIDIQALCRRPASLVFETSMVILCMHNLISVPYGGFVNYNIARSPDTSSLSYLTSCCYRSVLCSLWLLLNESYRCEMSSQTDSYGSLKNTIHGTNCTLCC